MARTCFIRRMINLEVFFAARKAKRKVTVFDEVHTDKDLGAFGAVL